MVPFFKALWWAIRYDEVAVRRWARGVLVLAGTVAAQVNSYTWEAAREWDWRSWAVVIATAAITGGGVMINLGERNPKDCCARQAKP